MTVEEAKNKQKEAQAGALKLYEKEERIIAKLRKAALKDYARRIEKAQKAFEFDSRFAEGDVTA